MFLFLDCLENNKNKDSTYQNVWCVAKAKLKYKGIALNYSFWKRMNWSKWDSVTSNKINNSKEISVKEIIKIQHNSIKKWSEYDVPLKK